MKKYNFTEEPFARAFLENPCKTMGERIALGCIEAAKYMKVEFPAYFLPDISYDADNSAVNYKWTTDLEVDPKRYGRVIEKHPQDEKELSELYAKMRQYDTVNFWLNSRNAEYIRYSDAVCCWGGRWHGHSNPDFGKFLKLGTNGLRRQIEEYSKKNPEAESFYNSCRLSLDAVDILFRRVRDEALRAAAAEKDGDRRRELERMADVYALLPQKPAWDMYSAMLMFWVIFGVMGYDSPGNFDRYMIDYFNASPESENRLMLDRFLEGSKAHRIWNLCISGSDENWNDTTNDLSYMLLEMVTEKGYDTPNLTLRVHRNTPERLWKMAVKSISTGTGLPSLYNDEVVCPALEKIGIPPQHSHLYCMNGCNQIDIFGKSHMGLEDGEVSFAKVLELTLHDGCDMLYTEPKRVAESLGDPADCESFEEFLQLYFRRLEAASDVACAGANASAEMYARMIPSGLKSCLLEGCIEKGRDYKNGGPLYGHAQILIEGLADAADSLYAVKKLVYDEKKYTLSELIEALRANYEGYDKLWHDFAFCDKFGNDIPEADALCARITDHFNAYLQTKRCFRGGVFTGGCSTFNRAADYGIHTSALPNGKRRGETNFADSIAATPGCDRKGPTALLKSLMHYNQTLPVSGFVTQLKFSKKSFGTEKGMAAFEQLAKVYFENGGQMLSVNVVDRQQLLAAQKNPEKYKNLVVRVGGYSALFCDLPADLQQNIIDRTEYTL